MGIDRHDVRCIAHLGPPGSVEAYYQESGRAGRDGDDAACLMLVAPNDMPRRRYLIENDGDGGRPDEESIRHKWNLFLELMRWSEGGSCRHDAILRYFGDEEETLSGCGRCDVCLQINEGDATEDEEVGTVVRKALCGVARVHGRFGMTVAAKLLKGAADERLDWSGLAQTPTHGTLEAYGEDWILTLLRRCVTAGWVDFLGGERPVVVVTAEGQDVIHQRCPARLLLPPVRSARVGATHASPQSSGSGRKKSAAVDIELDDQGQALFEALRTWRVATAKKAKVPPYVIGSDRTLREIAMTRPTNESELAQVHGIGPAKIEKYGEAILGVVGS